MTKPRERRSTGRCDLSTLTTKRRALLGIVTSYLRSTAPIGGTPLVHMGSLTLR